MAYVSKELKQKKLDALKKCIPLGWKWSLAVRDHSTLVLTIYSAPVDILSEIRHNVGESQLPISRMYWSLNPYHWNNVFDVVSTARNVMADVFAVLFDGNHDNSDPMTDYHDVGWYVAVDIGKWDTPFMHVQTSNYAIHKKAKAAEKAKAKQKSKPPLEAYAKYLPPDFAMLTPGKKAHATRYAIHKAKLADPTYWYN